MYDVTFPVHCATCGAPEWAWPSDPAAEGAPGERRCDACGVPEAPPKGGPRLDRTTMTTAEQRAALVAFLRSQGGAANTRQVALHFGTTAQRVSQLLRLTPGIRREVPGGAPNGVRGRPTVWSLDPTPPNAETGEDARSSGGPPATLAPGRVLDPRWMVAQVACDAVHLVDLDHLRVWSFVVDEDAEAGVVGYAVVPQGDGTGRLDRLGTHGAPPAPPLAVVAHLCRAEVP